MFEIDAGHIQALFERQKGRCALSGLPIEASKVSPTASLDRIESHRGYVRGNVQWVHKVVNIMKQNSDEAYFVAMCKQVAAHRGGGVQLSDDHRRLLAGQPILSKDRLSPPPGLSEFAAKKVAKTSDDSIGFGILL
ncbi:hypothetical protein [Bradyrhizobium sp. SZCCHNPS1003]|uniref:hypothetical protein n=1 Tax=Bradyrhizobium sp. SZCCHNPS1003 TaxID=3057330 RepID=UPI0028EBBBC5|nr:hypothetical protein [Bradyrhizobium sp. SZCCHNPS1003]